MRASKPRAQYSKGSESIKPPSLSTISQETDDWVICDFQFYLEPGSLQDISNY